MTIDSTESPEVQRNRILGDAIGLSHHEVAEFVTSIVKKDEGGQYRIHFSIQIQTQANEHVRLKIASLNSALFLDVGPIDFQGLQISKL